MTNTTQCLTKKVLKDLVEHNFGNRDIFSSPLRSFQSDSPLYMQLSVLFLLGPKVLIISAAMAIRKSCRIMIDARTNDDS